MNYASRIQELREKLTRLNQEKAVLDSKKAELSTNREALLEKMKSLGCPTQEDLEATVKELTAKLESALSRAESVIRGAANDSTV